MDGTKFLPGGDRLPDACSRQTPAILCNFTTAHSERLRCSPVAAAWELWELFSELSEAMQPHPGGDLLALHVCWVGSVTNPAKPKGTRQLRASDLAEYFERQALQQPAQPSAELVYHSTEAGKRRPLSDAAVGLCPAELAGLFLRAGIPVPAFLLTEPGSAELFTRYGEPLRGKRMETFRGFVWGLLEIAANAAARDRDSPFCRKVREVREDIPLNTAVSALLDAAAEIRLERFPGRSTLKEYLG